MGWEGDIETELEAAEISGSRSQTVASGDHTPPTEEPIEDRYAALRPGPSGQKVRNV